MVFARKAESSKVKKPPAALRSSASADPPVIAYSKGTVFANGALSFLKYFFDKLSPAGQEDS